MVVAVTADGDRQVVISCVLMLVGIRFGATMAQILDPLPSGKTSQILCCYVNATSNIQIARISNIPNWYFERVVFPGQRLLFETLPESLLEIHTGMMASAILSDKIPCDRLCMNEDEDCEIITVVETNVEKTDGMKSTVEVVNKKPRETSAPLTTNNIR